MITGRLLAPRRSSRNILGAGRCLGACFTRSDCALRGHLRGTLAFENPEGLRVFRIGPETKMH